MWIVCMFEPARPGERLTAHAQLNEVFGPFATEAEVDAWVDRMARCYMPGDRQWVVMQLSDPAVVDQLDPTLN